MSPPIFQRRRLMVRPHGDLYCQRLGRAPQSALLLAGSWLHRAGFQAGAQVDVLLIEPGHLVLRVIPPAAPVPPVMPAPPPCITCVAAPTPAPAQPAQPTYTRRARAARAADPFFRKSP